jgi:hypothetical protein
MLEDLKEWLDKEPFHPFRVVLTSGTDYEVTSPYQIAIGQTQFDYYFPKSDRKAVVRLNQIVSFETLDLPQSA